MALRSASASTFGVSISEPKQPRSEKPRSSSSMTITFGARSGGAGRGGHHGVDVVGRRPVVAPPRVENLGYLETKRQVMGHLLPAPPLEPDVEEALVVAVDHG